MTLALTEVQLTAALAELVYRRSDDEANQRDDVGITLAELGVTSVTGLDIDGLEADPNGLGLYYGMNGFAGQVVQTNDTIYIVFRGTDAGKGFSQGAIDSVLSGSVVDQTQPDHLFDLGDLYTDVALGKGSIGFTQLDYALALAKKAVEFTYA